MGGLQIDAQASRHEYSTVEASFSKPNLRMVRRLGEAMKRPPAGLLFALGLGLLSPLISAQAQTQAAPSADDPATAAQKAAFLALPEATRKALQEALVWLGLYVGVNDGDFGKHTRDAILAFQASVKAPADGTLSPPLLKALLVAAQKAREAAGFQVVSDPKTGAKIGAPLKLLGALPGAGLDFVSNADADLGALYTRLSATTPARKIAYKAIKPDAFFVVSGQDGPFKFYTRFDKNPNASPPIRGFTFAYPASQTAALDRIAIAIANSFEPFPGAAGSPTANAAGNPAASPASSAAPPSSVPQPAATALVVGLGKALTALKAADCPHPTVAGKPVRIERADAATGLAMLVGDFASNGGAPRFGAPREDLVVLGFDGSRLAASSASFTGGDARPVVTAAVNTSASSGPVFDRSGALVGLVAPMAGEPKHVGTVALASSHPLIAAETLRAFLGDSEPESEEAASLSAGDIAAREKKGLVAVFCQK
jgi:peptidoglycan hydrolase-like protein with peptidoglycan-binding domain